MKKWCLALSLLTILPLFAQTEEPPIPPSQGFTQMLLLFAIALVFFYFILWRPEQNRRKQAEEMRSKLKKGDRVNALGIIGTVDRMTDQTVILRMVDGAKIEVLKGAITEVTSGTADEQPKAAE